MHNILRKIFTLLLSLLLAFSPVAEAAASAPRLPASAFHAAPVSYESIRYQSATSSLTGCAATYWIENAYGKEYLLRLQYVEAVERVQGAGFGGQEEGFYTSISEDDASAGQNEAFSYSITYPAGAVAGYTYNTAGNIATVTSTPSGGSATTVANYTAAGYLPFGPPKGLTLGNGVTTSYTYDKDLNLLTILASNSILNLTYGYDNAGNLTSITDALTAANTQTLTYDVLNRITGATSGTGGYGTLSYAWDKNANRTSHTIGGTSTPYTTLTSTNKLTNVGAQAITTNSNGSVTGFAPAQASGLTTLAYNAAGRLATASSASATLTTNTYDATGMRVRKVAGSTTSRFVRGLGAELLQEITGSTRRNYIYANGVPVAQLNGTTLHYLHTDQRGAPVKATNASKTVRWSTRYEPFGATIGLTNPGSLVMNLRLPGQYADSESGLYDNGFRTYNPQTGRYLQSDPIGLMGGTNTFAYAMGKPFRYTDPSGLTSLEIGRPSNAFDIYDNDFVMSYTQDMFKIANPVGSGSNDDAFAIAAQNPLVRNSAIECGKYFILPSDKYWGFSFLLQAKGSFNNKDGIYEYIVPFNMDFLLGTPIMTHQRFIPDAPISGYPNNFKGEYPPYGDGPDA